MAVTAGGRLFLTENNQFPFMLHFLQPLGMLLLQPGPRDPAGEHRRQRAGRTDGPQVEVDKEKGKDGYKAEGMEQDMFSLYKNETDGVK